MRKKVEKIRMQYNCPFCKKDIVASKKTEVFYRSQWINGCSECFEASINELTDVSFQKRNY